MPLVDIALYAMAGVLGIVGGCAICFGIYSFFPRWATRDWSWPAMIERRTHGL